MEVHFARTVEQSLEDVVDGLRAGPAEWLPDYREVDGAPTGELRFEQAGAPIRRRVRLSLGAVQTFAYGVTQRVEWEAAQRRQLYPRLEGHLRIEGLEAGRTQVRFDARYTPPAGRLGSTVDRAVMHRVAEQSVQDFVERVTESLERLAGQRARERSGRST